MNRIALHASLAIATVPATLLAYYTFVQDVNTDVPSLGRGIILLFAAAVYVIYSQIQKANFYLRARSKGCESAAVYPHKDLFLGLDLLVKNLKSIKQFKLLPAFHSRFQALGNTYWNMTLGQWVVMTNDPENVKAIAATNFEDFHIAGPRLLAVLPALGPRSIFSSNGAAWHQSRSLLRPNFVRDQMADLVCFDRHIKNLLNNLPNDGSTFDIQALLMKMTIDSSTEFMFGYSTDMLTLPTPEAQAFAKAFEDVLELGARRAILGPVLSLIPSRTLNAGVQTLRNFVRTFVSKALVEKDSGKRARSHVFLDDLVTREANPEYIIDQILSVIIAGRDTTAAAMAACFYLLARHPDIVKQCRAEVLALETDKPTWEELRSIKLTSNVIKEALRLFPPISTNSRVAIRETVFPKGGGKDGQSPMLVPKGTACRWSLYCLHRRKDIFGLDADEFRPDRWNDLRTTWEYLPFHGGPRLCLGQQFALTQITYTLFRVLQRYEKIESRDPGPLLIKSSTSMSFAKGCLISLVPA